MQCVYASEGYCDVYNYADLSGMTTSAATLRKRLGNEVNTGKLVYEFTITPNLGFLGSPDPLLTDCELSINFQLFKYSTNQINFTAYTYF